MLCTILSSLFVFRIPICPLPGAVLSAEQVVNPSTSGLPKCFDPRCHTKPDWDSCDEVVGCYWCVLDKNNVSLTKKYCADISVCYGGKEQGECLLALFVLTRKRKFAIISLIT